MPAKQEGPRGLNPKDIQLNHLLEDSIRSFREDLQKEGRATLSWDEVELNMLFSGLLENTTVLGAIGEYVDKIELDRVETTDEAIEIRMNGHGIHIKLPFPLLQDINIESANLNITISNASHKGKLGVEIHSPNKKIERGLALAQRFGVDIESTLNQQLKQAIIAKLEPVKQSSLKLAIVGGRLKMTATAPVQSRQEREEQTAVPPVTKSEPQPADVSQTALDSEPEPTFSPQQPTTEPKPPAPPSSSNADNEPVLAAKTAQVKVAALDDSSQTQTLEKRMDVKPPTPEGPSSAEPVSDEIKVDDSLPTQGQRTRWLRPTAPDQAQKQPPSTAAQIKSSPPDVSAEPPSAAEESKPAFRGAGEHNDVIEGEFTELPEEPQPSQPSRSSQPEESSGVLRQPEPKDPSTNLEEGEQERTPEQIVDHAIEKLIRETITFVGEEVEGALSGELMQDRLASKFLLRRHADLVNTRRELLNTMGVEISGYEQLEAIRTLPTPEEKARYIIDNDLVGPGEYIYYLAVSPEVRHSLTAQLTKKWGVDTVVGFLRDVEVEESNLRNAFDSFAGEVHTNNVDGEGEPIVSRAEDLTDILRLAKLASFNLAQGRMPISLENQLTIDQFNGMGIAKNPQLLGQLLVWGQFAKELGVVDYDFFQFFKGERTSDTLIGKLERLHEVLRNLSEEQQQEVEKYLLTLGWRLDRFYDKVKKANPRLIVKAE